VTAAARAVAFAEADDPEARRLDEIIYQAHTPYVEGHLRLTLHLTML